MAAPTPDQPQAALQALLNGPASPPPAGVVPNFDDPPQNLIVVLHVTAALCLSVSASCVAIRIYTKHFLLRSIGYEDCKDCTSVRCHLH